MLTRDVVVIPASDWPANLVGDPVELHQIVRLAHRIAVLGIDPWARHGLDSYDVPHSLAVAGFEVLPVPTGEPKKRRILGRPVFRHLADIPDSIDVAEVFCKRDEVPGLVEDLLDKRPAVVWFQRGIRHDAAAERLARAGLKVVQDRCLLTEYRRSFGSLSDWQAP